MTDKVKVMRETFETLYGIKTPPFCIPIRTRDTTVIKFINCNISVPKLNPNFHVILPNDGHMRIHQTKTSIHDTKGNTVDIVYGCTDVSGELRVTRLGPASEEALESPMLIFDIYLWTLWPGTEWVYEATIKDCVLFSYTGETDGCMLSFQARAYTDWTLVKQILVPIKSH